MKKITFLLLQFLICTIAFAQINGNKNIVTKTFPIDDISTLMINLTANITIDLKGKKEITITTDSNLIPYIDRKVKNGKLDLTQKEWIQSSGEHKLTIGAPALRKLISDAHSDIFVKNLETAEFDLMANVGKISLEGKTENLNINANVAMVNAADLTAENANVTISSWGKVKVQVTNKLTTSVDENGFLFVVNTPKELAGDAAKALAQTDMKKTETKEVRYIDFKIKNNSLSRNNYVVLGPKPDGSSFGYGFPLWPGQIRKERWTTGTKIYMENAAGVRKLVTTISAEDENQIVNLKRDR